MRLRARVMIFVIVMTACASCAAQDGSTAPRATSAPVQVHLAAMVSARTPSQLRAEFDQLLGQHTIVAVRVMRSVVSKAPDDVAALAAALPGNTDALTSLVASAYGTSAADEFKRLWQGHIADLVSYAKAVVARDDRARNDASTSLLRYSDAYGVWFSKASKSRITPAAAAAAVRMHVTDLMGQIDAYGARDYDTAYRMEREAYEHMFSAGTTLAQAGVTPELAVGLDSPPQRLRTTFAMLLGEHMQFIVEAQRAAFASPAEFNGAAAQVNINTDALTKGMTAIVGDKKGAEFNQLWADHVDGLMAYTAAAARNDQPGKAKTKADLDSFAGRLAAYFSGVVNKRIPTPALVSALMMHDTELIQHVDAYAAKNFVQAQQLQLVGYQHILGVANTLVDAIDKTLQSGLPRGGPQTGGGGTARSPR